MRDKLPEEKLLNVIKNDRFVETKVPMQAQKRRFIIFDLKFFKKIFSFKQFIVLLAIASLGLLMFTVSLFFWNPEEEISLSLLDQGEKSLSEQLRTEPIAELDTYTMLAKEKNIFKLSKETSSAASDNTAIKDLLLLGIVTQEPKQAIIKDVNSGNTFFLELGNSFLGMKVVEITEGLVKIEIDGDISELRL